MNHTFENLIKYAKSWYNLEETDVRKILKDAGHNNFKKDNYFVYLNVLRRHWNHLIELKEERPLESTRERLLRESASVKMIEDRPNGWRYEGDPKALQAYWELQDLLRKENVRRCIAKWSPIGGLDGTTI